MSRKPIRLRPSARADEDDIGDYYAREAGLEVAARFANAVAAAYDLISRHPASGSPRWAHDLDLPGLRSTPVAGFPHLVFYFERHDHVDVSRVLHVNGTSPC